VPAGEGVLEDLGLMRVELRDASRGERRGQASVESIRERRVLRGDGWQAADGGDVMVRRVFAVRWQPGRKP
jgi:hypothetical protein